MGTVVMTSTNGKPSLVDEAYRRILKRLYERGLGGGRLHAKELADTFGVSRTPVNMALVRLEAEGLVERSPIGGWEVVPLTPEEVDEIFDLKDVLDSMMARKAAENITPGQAEELRGVLAEMERASRTGDVSAWVSADGHYHQLVAQIAGNKRLRRFQEELNKQFYRLWVGYSSMEGRMVDSCAQHTRIGNAICEGNPEVAAEAAYAHTRVLRKNLIELIEKVLTPFLGQEL